MNLPSPDEFVRQAKPIFSRFQADAAAPQTAFAETWEAIHGKISKTEFWQKHGLDHRLDKNRVTTYEDYREALDKAASGSFSPLNEETVLNWTLSSGSSGPSKIFPITASYKAQVDEQHLCFLYAYFQRFPKFLSQPMHYLATSGPIKQNSAGINFSYISNFNYRNLPVSFRKFFGVPENLFQSPSDLAKWRPIYMLAEDCSAIVAGAPSAVINLFEQINGSGPEMYEFLSGRRPLLPHLPALTVSPERKRQLAACGLESGKPVLAKLWPSLQFIACWTSGVCRMQSGFLRSLLEDKVPVIALPFASTEAWMTVCLSDEDGSGAINPRAALIEFSPVNAEAPCELLKPWQLEVGKSYEMYITNLMGLVRYRIQDVVECTGYYQKVAEISFVRKASQEISLAGVTLNETQLQAAVSVVDELKDSLLFFAPNAQGRGLVLYVASESALNDDVTRKVEAELFKQSEVYQEDFKAGLLVALTARAVSPKHAIWKLDHSQAKLYLIRQTAPEGL